MSTSTPIGTVCGVAEKVSGAAYQAETKASGLSQMAAEKVDQSRATAADGLDSAAATLHEKADNLPGGKKLAGATHTVANALESAADYVRANNLKDMTADVQQLVKNHPGVALLTAAALGFLVARTFSRN